MGIFGSILSGLGGIVGSIVGGSDNAKAAQKASDAQVAADQAAIAEQRRQFDITQKNFAPWLDAGGAALSQERDLLGIGGQATAPTIDYGAYVRSNPDILRDYQVHHAGEDINTYGKYHYETQGQAAGDSLTPFTTGGGPASQDSANAAQQTAISNLQNSPLYTSLYNNGRDAVLANESATGGLRGGNTIQGLANFGRDTLSGVIQNQLANLGGISGNGLSSAGSLGSIGQGTANSISNLLTQQGSATAGGILGVQGAWNGASQGISNVLAGLLKSGAF